MKTPRHLGAAYNPKYASFLKFLQEPINKYQQVPLFPEAIHQDINQVTHHHYLPFSADTMMPFIAMTNH